MTHNLHIIQYKDFNISRNLFDIFQCMGQKKLQEIQILVYYNLATFLQKYIVLSFFLLIYIKRGEDKKMSDSTKSGILLFIFHLMNHKLPSYDLRYQKFIVLSPS